jgi:hypothetical protein
MARRSANPKPKRIFADIDAARKRYNPEAEGYGNPSEWRGAFYQRMGFEEAQRVKEEAQAAGKWRSEYRIIGDMAGVVLGENSTWGEIKAAFRKAALNCHPDRAKGNGMSEETAKVKFQEVRAAYTILAERYGE